MTSDDNELAKRAGAGDAEAFQVLIERHYDLIYRVAYRLTGTREDGEDIAQDICCALPVKLKSFRARSQLTTWLYRVTVNAARDHLRRRSRQRRLDDDHAELAALSAADAADSGDRVEWLHEALDRLGTDLRETAIVVLGEDLTHAEAGKVLGIKESTVSWRMHEIRKQLKSLFAQDLDGSP